MLVYVKQTTLFSYRKKGYCNNRSGMKMGAFYPCTSFYIGYRPTIYSVYVRLAKKEPKLKQPKSNSVVLNLKSLNMLSTTDQD